MAAAESASGSPSKYPSISKVCSPQTCTAVAHNKMALHSIKYNWRPVIGVLIGYRRKTKHSEQFHVMDAIPLIHNAYSAVVLELAFLQIQIWLESINASRKLTEPLSVIGAYFANGNAEDSSKLTGAVLICDKLLKSGGKGLPVVLAQIDADRIEAAYKTRDSCVDFYTVKNSSESVFHSSNWQLRDTVALVIPTMKLGTVAAASGSLKSHEESLLSVADCKVLKFSELGLKELIDAKKDEEIVDFEEHLEDTARDWRNYHIC